MGDLDLLGAETLGEAEPAPQAPSSSWWKWLVALGAMGTVVYAIFALPREALMPRLVSPGSRPW